jgi:hypothetical protein
MVNGTRASSVASVLVNCHSAVLIATLLGTAIRVRPCLGGRGMNMERSRDVETDPGVAYWTYVLHHRTSDDYKIGYPPPWLLSVAREDVRLS